MSGSGLDGICASGNGDFPDENFSVKHDVPGILSMSGNARHSNNSQFFVTLQALPWLDEKRVAFGRVISGMRVLRKIESCDTKNQRPRDEILIKDCGVLLLDGDAAPKSTVGIESRTLETQTSLLMYVYLFQCFLFFPFYTWSGNNNNNNNNNKHSIQRIHTGMFFVKLTILV